MQFANRRLPPFLIDISILLLVFTALVLSGPDKSFSELDMDEGINAMKALLLSKGFHLYSDIWSDQPPLFTYLLKQWMELFGQSLVAGRALVSFTAAVLAASLFSIIRKNSSLVAAVLTLSLLLISCRFIKYSGALMIGLPALSFAVLSIALLPHSAKTRSAKQRCSLMLSGSCFAAGVLTKLYVIAVFPAIFVEICRLSSTDSESPKDIRQIFIDLVVWAVATIIAAAVLIWMIAPALPAHFSEQLLGPHLQYREQLRLPGLVQLIGFARCDYYLWRIAAVGLAICFVRAQWRVLAPAAWLFTAVLLLANHRPLWPHHYLLVSIPTVWIAALGLMEAVKTLKSVASSGEFKLRGQSKILVGAYLLLLLPLSFFAIKYSLNLPDHLSATARGIARTGHKLNPQALQLLKDYAPSTKWVVSDRPVYPFLANLPVPPEIAVSSAKRASTKQFSLEQFLNVIDKYEPEIILLKRFPGFPRAVGKHVKGDYRRVRYYRVKGDLGGVIIFLKTKKE